MILGTMTMTDEKLRAAARDLGENVLWLVEQILIKHNVAILESSKEAIDDAVAAEREACAKVAEAYEPRCDICPSGVANAIRARGKK